MVSCEGLTRAQTLAALYNRAQPLGMGMLHYRPGDMSIEQAEEILAQTPDGYFDYLVGRVMKVRLKEDGKEFDERMYDRDNGLGAASEAIQRMRDRLKEQAELAS